MVSSTSVINIDVDNQTFANLGWPDRNQNLFRLLSLTRLFCLATFPEMYDLHPIDCCIHFGGISHVKLILTQLYHLTNIKWAIALELTNRNPGHGYLDKTLRHFLIDHIVHLDFQQLVFVCILLRLQRMGLLAHCYKIHKHHSILVLIISPHIVISVPILFLYFFLFAFLLLVRLSKNCRLIRHLNSRITFCKNTYRKYFLRLKWMTFDLILIRFSFWIHLEILTEALLIETVSIHSKLLLTVRYTVPGKSDSHKTIFGWLLNNNWCLTC